MKPTTTVLLCCALALAACGKDPYEPSTTAQPAPAPASPPAAAPAPATPPADSSAATTTADTSADTTTAPDATPLPGTTPPTTASATGKVDAVDTAAGVITIAHDPVDVLGWPAMTMGFKATPEQIAAVKIGDSVRFEFDTKGTEATIVTIASTDE